MDATTNVRKLNISNYNDSLPFIDSCLVVYRFIRRRIEWLLLWQYGFIWLTLSTIQVGVKTFFELLLYHNSFIYNICDRILKKLHVIYHVCHLHTCIAKLDLDLNSMDFEPMTLPSILLSMKNEMSLPIYAKYICQGTHIYPPSSHLLPWLSSPLPSSKHRVNYKYRN